MPAEAIAEGFTTGAIQRSPAPDTRILAVGADNPTGLDVANAGDASAPEQFHAEFLRAIDQRLVQADAPHGDTASVRKIRGYRTAGADKADSAKSETLLGIERNAQLAQRRERIRHQAFAASFIDRWLCGVRHHHVEAFELRRNRSGQARWSAAGYEDVGPIYHRNNTSSEQNPGPMAARML